MVLAALFSSSCKLFARTALSLYPQIMSAESNKGRIRQLKKEYAYYVEANS